MAEARLRRRIGWFLALALLLAGLAGGGFVWLAQDYAAPGPAERTVRIERRTWARPVLNGGSR